MYEDSDLQGWRMGGLPLSDPPDDKDGFRFSHSTFNEDGIKCEVWKKDWVVLGAWIIYEKHDAGCDCSYCHEKTNQNWGLDLPECRCRNAWRVFWWRSGKWPYEYSYFRVTLPRFMMWRCRRCRKEKKRELAANLHNHTKANPRTISQDPRAYM